MSLMKHKLDGELPRPLLERYAALDDRLTALEKKRFALEHERHSLLRKIAMGFTLADFNRARECRSELLVLLDAERAVRVEFGAWLDDLLPAAEALRVDLQSRYNETLLAIRAKLAKIGYDEAGITAAHGGDIFAKSFLAGVLPVHPDAVRAQSRVKELSRLVDSLINPFSEISPVFANQAALKALGAELAAAIKANEALLGTV